MVRSNSPSTPSAVQLPGPTTSSDLFRCPSRATCTVLTDADGRQCRRDIRQSERWAHDRLAAPIDHRDMFRNRAPHNPMTTTALLAAIVLVMMPGPIGEASAGDALESASIDRRAIPVVGSSHPTMLLVELDRQAAGYTGRSVTDWNERRQAAADRRVLRERELALADAELAAAALESGMLDHRDRMCEEALRFAVSTLGRSDGLSVHGLGGEGLEPSEPRSALGPPPPDPMGCGVPESSPAHIFSSLVESSRIAIDPMGPAAVRESERVRELFRRATALPTVAPPLDGPDPRVLALGNAPRLGLVSRM